MPDEDALSVTFYVCEDVRMESDGKVSLMGFFPDATVIVKVEGVVPTEQAPILLEGLSFLLAMKGLRGAHSAQVSITDPAGTSPSTMTQIVQFSEYKNSNLIVRAKPFAVRRFGTFRIKATVNGQSFSSMFFIKPAVAATSPEPATTTTKRTRAPRKTKK